MDGPLKAIPTDWPALLSQLQKAVALQASFLQRQDFDGLTDAGRRVDELLQIAGKQLSIPPGECQELLSQIQAQQRATRMQLAQQKQSTAAELAKLQRGEAALRAYSGN